MSIKKLTLFENRLKRQILNTCRGIIDFCPTFDKVVESWQKYLRFPKSIDMARRCGCLRTHRFTSTSTKGVPLGTWWTTHHYDKRVMFQLTTSRTSWANAWRLPSSCEQAVEAAKATASHSIVGWWHHHYSTSRCDYDATKRTKWCPNWHQKVESLSMPDGGRKCQWVKAPANRSQALEARSRSWDCSLNVANTTKCPQRHTLPERIEEKR